MTPTTAEPELGFLLEGYQLRDPELSERFDAVARPIMRRMAKKRTYGLPKDAIEDVVQEAFSTLSNPELVRFDAASGVTASQYLHGRILNAVKTTQISFGLRRAGSDFENEPQREFVPIEDEHMYSKLDIPEAAIYARHTVAKIFRNVEPRMQDACIRVYCEDESQTEVAADLDISRFALARQFTAIRGMALQTIAVV